MTKPRPFGHYFILEKIAQGGMAEIFKGLTYDFSGLKKFIVIKRILPHISANKNFIKMLVDEAKIAVRLSHGNIAQTFDLGKVSQDYFIVMEYVEGHTLSQIFKKASEYKLPIPVPLAAYVIAEICNGLDYMHRVRDDSGESLEIVHCDISPQNVILSEHGTVKIVDFGVAKAAFKLSEMEKGVLKGKFAYMSPEQAEGISVDARSDIFSTGVVLWELLTGRRLFKKKSNSETIEAVQNMIVYPPSAYRNEIPSELDDIAMHALERQPDKRYFTASDMALDLTKFLLKHYPEFKPYQIQSYLQELFANEDNTSDLYQEKTTREEVTFREQPRGGEGADDGTTPVEETFLIDPQELDFHSVFEEIELEEPSEVTRALDGPLSVEVDSLIEEDTGDIPADLPPPPSSRETNRSGLYILLILVALMLGLCGILWYYSDTTSQLKITFQPPDAQVFLDGKALRGSSPIQLSGLKPRVPYHLKISREGYQGQDKKLSLYPGLNSQVSFQLKKEDKGGLQVNSSPPGAAIFIDGQPTGRKTPAFLEAKNLKFPLVLGLSSAGPPQWQQRIEYPPTQVSEIFGDLEKSYGTIDVETSPSGATVRMSGEVIGKTPLYTQRVLAGKKVMLQIEKKGFQTVQKQLVFKPGQNQKIYQPLVVVPSR